MRLGVVAGQGAFTKSTVLGCVKDEFVFVAGRQGGIDAETRIEIAADGHRTDAGDVFRAGHEQPWQCHTAKRTLGAACGRDAGAHHERGFDARIGKACAADGICVQNV